MWLREPDASAEPEQSPGELAARLIGSFRRLPPHRQDGMLRLASAVAAEDWRRVRRLQGELEAGGSFEQW